MKAHTMYDRSSKYEETSMTLVGAVSMSTGVMIGAGILALTGQIAELAGPLFPLAFLAAAVVTAFSAYSYVKMSNAYPSAGGIAMLTDMELVPHSHFGMPGSIQKHTLVYTVVIAIFLTIFFDLSRIASLGAIFYIVMDIVVHWGVLRYLRKEINANAAILITAIVFDVVVLGVFLKVKASVI